ncbi:MAG: ADP-forming succinate--CoA ligase subunit beta [Armatimonadota bacterium]
MLIHEYQAKNLKRKFDIALPKGSVAATPEEAYKIAREIGEKVVVKAQVHAGGRGKAGGVKLCNTPEDAKKAAEDILGMKIKGLTVEKVLVEEAVNIDKEFYIGITLDRAKGKNCFMFSPVGGVDIEETAVKQPDKIFKEYIDPYHGLQGFQIRKLIYPAGLTKEQNKHLADFMRKLYLAYEKYDCSLAEINPLVLTKEGKFVAADAKINIDDNALFRHPELMEFKESAHDDEIEKIAHHKNIAYVRLGGDIGVIGNGAGLVMTTIDMVSIEGGKAANFLDVGGGASVDTVKQSLELILTDKNVKGVLFNIFGGIVRCDTVAQGIVNAIESLNIKVPIVIRLSGTREEEGRQILKTSNLISAESMQDGARKIVELVKKA